MPKNADADGGATPGRDDEPLIRRRALAMAKQMARSVVRAPRSQRRILLIFGCQRSGTTMLQQTILDRSWRVLILEEHDKRLVGNTRVVEETDWQDYSTVIQRLRQIPIEVVVAKPLVESSQAVELMDAAGEVKAIWMLRRYDGVARSNIKRFGLENAYHDLAGFCENDPLDWRSRGSSEETRSTIKRLVGEGVSPLDAAALFWWARNRLYFQQELWRDERIRILRYERTCDQTKDVVEALSSYLGITLPVSKAVSRTRPQLRSEKNSGLHPEVERLCQELWDSFDGLPEL